MMSYERIMRTGICTLVIPLMCLAPACMTRPIAAPGSPSTTSPEAPKARWLCTGPPQNFVTSILIDPYHPNFIVLGSDDAGGIYVSRDGGDTVEQVYGDVAAMSRGSSPDFRAIFVGDWYGRGVRRSLDGGLTWEGANRGLEDSLSVADVCVLPTEPLTVLAATKADFRGVKRTGGLFKSVDLGVSWQAGGFRGRNCRGLAACAARPDRVYVGVEGVGFYRSEDRGDTWTPCGLRQKRWFFPAVDPRNADVVIVGTMGEGIFRTEDAGATWTKTSSAGQDAWIRDLSMCRSHPDTVYAATLGSGFASNPHPYGGIYKSTDNGRSWIEVGLPEVTCLSIGVDPTNPDRAYAGTYGGAFYRTVDGGRTWQTAGKGLRTSYITSRPWIDPNDAGTVYVGTHGTNRNCVLWKTTDGGETWQSTGAHDFGGNEISGGAVLKLDTESGPVLLLGLRYEGLDDQYAGTWCSKDDGQTWSKVLDANMLDFVIRHDGAVIGLTRGTGIWVSNDTGITWGLLGADGHYVASLWQDPTDPDRFLAGLTLPDLGMLESRDGGTTWAKTTFPDTVVTDLEPDPFNPARIYASGAPGPFVSNDGGRTWSLLNDFKTHAFALSADPKHDGTLYVSARGLQSPGAKQGLWRTQDHGKTWEHLSEGLVTQLFGSSGTGNLAMGADGTVWAGTEANGLWRYRP